MYAAAGGNQVDHELYLLGKPVDKAVDPMAQENEEVHFFQLVFIMKIVVRWDQNILWLSTDVLEI